MDLTLTGEAPVLTPEQRDWDRHQVAMRRANERLVAEGIGDGTDWEDIEIMYGGRYVGVERDAYVRLYQPIGSAEWHLEPPHDTPCLPVVFCTGWDEVCLAHAKDGTLFDVMTGLDMPELLIVGFLRLVIQPTEPDDVADYLIDKPAAARTEKVEEVAA